MVYALRVFNPGGNLRPTTCIKGTRVTDQALTDEKFWDEAWEQTKKKRVLKAGHPYFGKNGVFMKVMRRHAGPLEGKSVIELGGGGPNMRLLALKKWANVDAATIDFSPVGLQEVDHLFKSHQASLEMHEGDFTTYDFQGRTFDIVVHWGVLEHFKDMAPILELCRRLLRPDGVMVFSMPNMKSIGSAAWKRWSPENWAAHEYHASDSIAEACGKAGLVLEEEFYFGYPFLGKGKFEKKGILPKAVSKVQALSIASCAVFPFYDKVGHRIFSTQRAFRVRPASGQ
jgi:2-polyprenyl-3-methyl-5-hydroxy-6-metoxy-1,4-benzoquinol methylase